MQLQRHSVLAAVAALSLLVLPHLGRATSVGQPVPRGTAANQTLRWNGTSYVFAGLMDTGTSAYLPTGYTLGVGGQSDGSSLYLSPSVSQNALTIKAPAGGSGSMIRVLSNTGLPLYSVDTKGGEHAQSLDLQGGAFGINADGDLSFSGIVQTTGDFSVDSATFGSLYTQTDLEIRGDLIINGKRGFSGTFLGATYDHGIVMTLPSAAPYTGNVPSTAQSTHVKGGVIVGYTASDGSVVGQ